MRPTGGARRGVVACVGAVVLGALGCVTQATYDAEVMRAEGLRLELEEERGRTGELERKVRALTATRETLELERSSLDQERIALLDEIEDLRVGNDELAVNLARERHVREQREAELEALSGTYAGLVEQLEAEIQAGQIEIHRLRGRLQVRALESILFDSGSSSIKREGREVLAKVATQLRTLTGHRIVVEGHTDSIPIATERFPSNWELSAGRGASVVRFFVSEGVDPQLLAASGQGEYEPIADNGTREGRARNRRIEIVLIPDGE
jgi:chemotaxis protein MotB